MDATFISLVEHVDDIHDFAHSSIAPMSIIVETGFLGDRFSGVTDARDVGGTASGPNEKYTKHDEFEGRLLVTDEYKACKSKA